MRMVTTFLNIIFPKVCIMCNCPAQQNNLCNKCIEQLPIKKFSCPNCANATPTNAVCGNCLDKKPIWQNAYVPFHYSGIIQYIIKQLKYHHQPHLAKTLAFEFYRHYSGEKPDAIIPVPLHKKRLSFRKFNQSYLIAKHLAHLFAVPLLQNVAYRKKDTQSQTQLNNKQRAKNMKNAFVLKHKEKIQGKHLVLCDDVYTTGSTLTSLSKEIKKFKPSQIDVWCIARSGKE